MKRLPGLQRVALNDPDVAEEGFCGREDGEHSSSTITGTGLKTGHYMESEYS
jgi:hypothetical protein